MTALDQLMRYLPHRSVRARFAWATGLSGVCFAIVLSMWVARDQREQLQHTVSDSVRREAHVLGQIVSMALSERQHDLNQMASQPDVASGLMDSGATRLLLERTRASHPEFEWLALVNAKGVITTATGTRLEGQNFSAQDWFVAGMRAPWLGKPHLAGPLAPFLPRDVDGRPVQLIDMAVPIVDYEGRNAGVIVGMLNWRWIRDMHAAMVSQDENLVHTLLMTPSGEVAIGPPELIGQTLNLPGLDEVRSGHAVKVMSWPDIGPQLTAAAPVRWAVQDGKPPLVMVLRQDPELVYGPADQLWQRMLMVGLLASLVFMAVSWWLAGRVVRPLRSLAGAASALQEGEAAQFDVGPDQPDEITALSQALHDMHSRLQMRMSELASYRDHLEETVARRTEQLRFARDKAEAATRAKSAFIANMSHEIRTPMNAIMGVTYLMQQGPLLPGQAERLKTVHEAAEHLLNIINNILDLSKIEAGMFTLSSADFELSAILQKAVAMVADKAREKGLALVVDTDDSPLHLRGDDTRLSQVLINLLSNAVKFTDQGEVRLSVRPHPAPAGKVGLRIEVADSGAGIPADKVGRLFNAFVQADDSTTRRYGGTGLGLAITRSLVELMGGQIGVVSEAGQGSVFWCTVVLEPAHLPGEVPALPSSTAALTAEQAAALLREAHAGTHVLLAEDNPVNGMLAAELLQMAGMVTTTVRSGREAVERVQQQAFDLILMDVHMPDMDGLEATRLIRQTAAGQGLPIIAMTASVLQEERDACMAAGMNGHLAKPIDTQALFQALLQWLGARKAAQARAAAQQAWPA